MRRPVTDIGRLLGDAERDAAAASVAAFAGVDKKRGPRGRAGRVEVRRLVDEIRQLVRGDGPKVMKPRELVALYYLCHTEVYGAEPTELVGDAWRQACLAVGRLIKTEFAGNSADVVEFVRWTWRRERWREERRQDGERKWRITWRQQFVRRDLLSDYRTEQARRARRETSPRGR
jgi:hypothetical protein